MLFAMIDTDTTTYLKDIAVLVQSAVTVAAILLGGLWSYFLFVKKRQKYPRAVISQEFTRRPLVKGKVLLSIRTVVRNAGDVLLSLETGEVRVQQVLPLSDDLKAVLLGEGDLVGEGGTEVEWPLISSRRFQWEKGDCEIEPGESERVDADFILDSHVRTITAYSHFQNTKKRKRDIGWGLTTVYDITPTPLPAGILVPVPTGTSVSEKHGLPHPASTGADRSKPEVPVDTGDQNPSGPASKEENRSSQWSSPSTAGKH